ncbi:hypothetical protein LshimejAT787_1203040 [Lyophyllum shimeji]|uniref:Uncharacterized protein n=1 Tax=Lyophyllum shimeji TaxID=47721 RepID=A0A9P3PU04_LYOSH|nr:hypothetical protein LshimejAT787_1203040 [Lyophyllum shimeji]
MASWLDFLVLFATIVVVGGVIYGVLYISKQISQGVASTKENLKSRGMTISQQGVSIKTSKRFDRADYVDATQRGFVKAYEASTFGSNSNNSSPGRMQRADSASSVKSSFSSSTGSEEKEKKKTGMSNMFRRKDNHSSSGSKEKL